MSGVREEDPFPQLIATQKKKKKGSVNKHKYSLYEHSFKRSPRIPFQSDYLLQVLPK